MNNNTVNKRQKPSKRGFLKRFVGRVVFSYAHDFRWSVIRREYGWLLSNIWDSIRDLSSEIFRLVMQTLLYPLMPLLLSIFRPDLVDRARKNFNSANVEVSNAD